MVNEFYSYIKNFFYGEKQVEKVYLNGKLIWARSKYSGFAESQTEGLAFFHQPIRETIGGKAISNSYAQLDAKVCKQEFIKDGVVITFNQKGISKQLKIEYASGTSEDQSIFLGSTHLATLALARGTEENGIDLDTMLTIVVGLLAVGTGQSINNCESLASNLLSTLLYTLNGETQSYSNTHVAKNQKATLKTATESNVHTYLQAVVPGWINELSGLSQEVINYNSEATIAATICALAKTKTYQYVSDKSFQVITPLKSYAYAETETEVSENNVRIIHALWVRTRVKNQTYDHVLTLDGNSMRIQGLNESFNQGTGSIFTTDSIHAYGSNKEIESLTKNTIKLQPVSDISTLILEETCVLGISAQQTVEYQGGQGNSVFENQLTPHLWWIPIGDDVPLAEHQLSEELLQKDGNTLEIQQAFQVEISNTQKTLEVN